MASRNKGCASTARPLSLPDTHTQLLGALGASAPTQNRLNFHLIFHCSTSHHQPFDELGKNELCDLLFQLSSSSASDVCHDSLTTMMSLSHLTPCVEHTQTPESRTRALQAALCHSLSFSRAIRRLCWCKVHAGLSFRPGNAVSLEREHASRSWDSLCHVAPLIFMLPTSVHGFSTLHSRTSMRLVNHGCQAFLQLD